jgi:glycosyltransferase involved in cell wall biosynthesis
MWVLHQHRPAYDLWDHELGSDLIHTPAGAVIRDAIRHADREFLPEARAIFANSRNVSGRLASFCGIPSTPLYHPPPPLDRIASTKTENYLFFPSRLSPPKRQMLAIEALARTQAHVRLVIAGAPSAPGYDEILQQKARSLGVRNRIEWLGRITDQEKAARYAACAGVLFPPFDEDYGYVTLEAMLAGKPVITCSDSGGPLEFVLPGETGLVAEPNPTSLAEAMDAIWSDPNKAALMGRSGRDRYSAMGIAWPNVVQTLLNA